MFLLLLCEFFGQHGLTHLLCWQRRSFVLERFSATKQRNLKISEHVVQLCLRVAPEFFYDLAFVVLGNGILLAMAVLEAALLRFEWLELCYSISSQTGYGRGGQLVFAMLVMKGLLYVVSANERKIHAHELDIYNVVHKKEELGLCPWRLCNQLVQLLERWHVWGIVSEMAHDIFANGFS